MSTHGFCSFRGAQAPRWFVLLVLLGLSALLLTPARAGLVTVAYGGSGNAVLFDAATGSGGWVGALDEVLDEPGVAGAVPLSLVSVVLFEFDAATGELEGQFEFTDSLDLDSALVGTLTGRTADADLFGAGGQFEIDYLITSGRGRFEGFSGFGLAFLDFDPDAAGDNYRESGLLVLSVPVSGTLGLAALALGMVGLGAAARSAAPGRAASAARSVSENRAPVCIDTGTSNAAACANPISGPRASTSSAPGAGSARVMRSSSASARDSSPI